MYYENDYQSILAENSISGKSVLINLDTVVGKMSDLDLKVFRIIVSKGISEEKEAKEIVIDTLIEEEKNCHSKDSVWRSIDRLVTLDILRKEKINTGYRVFNMLYLSTSGDYIYKCIFKKNPPPFEHEKLRKEHGSYQHGYMIKDVKCVLEKRGFINVTTGRKENCMNFTDGKQLIPDVIAFKGGKQFFFEVECGNHNQEDFNDKCNRLKAVTNTIVFIVKNRDDAKRKLRPQIENWFRKVRGSLKYTNTKVYLISITDFINGKFTYIFDPNEDEPICCFEKKRKEGKDND